MIMMIIVPEVVQEEGAEVGIVIMMILILMKIEADQQGVAGVVDEVEVVGVAEVVGEVSLHQGKELTISMNQIYKK